MSSTSTATLDTATLDTARLETRGLGTAALELSWRPELADYVEAFRARSRQRGGYARAGAVAAVVGALTAIGVGTANPLLISAGGSGLAALAVLVLVVRPMTVRRLWRRSPALRGDVRASIDPREGITVAAQTIGHYPWSSVHSVLEGERVFVVQLDGYRTLPFFLLAKRGTQNPAEIEDVRRSLAAATGR